MASAGRVIVAGAALGVVGWFIYRGSQGATVDTAEGEAGGWLSGADDFLEVGYRVAGAIMPGNMEISLVGLNHLKQVEGYRATPYKDIAGHWTGGYGHKLGPLEHKGARTAEEWSRILAADVTTAEAAVNRLVKVPLTQAQFDALVSFVFNVGTGAFSRSTMLQKLNAGDYAGAQAQFGKWIYAGGQVSEGIRNRRVAEARLFSGNVGATV
jgi:lysozyme